MALSSLECKKCHDILVKKDGYYECPSCGARYLVGTDDDGQQFIYETIVKKTIEVGQMASKASKIEVQQIDVKSIKLSENLHQEILQDGTQLGENELDILVVGKLKNKEWQAAQEAINEWMKIHNNNAEARWYSMMVENQSTTWKELINKKFKNLTEHE